MRRASAVVLAVVVAVLSPVRQACGTTCVAAPEPVASPVKTECHAPEPVPAEPQPEHCAHDHSGALIGASRMAADAEVHAAIIEPRATTGAMLEELATAAPALPAARGWPPSRLSPLRI